LIAGSFLTTPSARTRAIATWANAPLIRSTLTCNLSGKKLSSTGSGRRDPVWPVDIFFPQASEAQQILGFMLADAINGFPVPFYPLCLQKAHESAALIDFDFDILQDYVYEGIRSSLANEGAILDVFRLQDTDPAQKRYE